MAQEFADFVIEQDFTDIVPMDGTFSLCPTGDYIFDIVHLEQKTSSKGNPMVVVTSEVARDLGQENEGQRVWANYPLVQQSLGRLKNLMVACGAPLGQFRAAELMGARFRGTVIHTKGDAQIGPDGVPQEPKTFANLVNERPLEEAQPETKVEPPPVTKQAPAATQAKGAAKASNGQPRRA